MIVFFFLFGVFWFFSLRVLFRLFMSIVFRLRLATVVNVFSRLIVCFMLVGRFGTFIFIGLVGDFRVCSFIFLLFVFEFRCFKVILFLAFEVDCVGFRFFIVFVLLLFRLVDFWSWGLLGILLLFLVFFKDFMVVVKFIRLLFRFCVI